MHITYISRSKSVATGYGDVISAPEVPKSKIFLFLWKVKCILPKAFDSSTPLFGKDRCINSSTKTALSHLQEFFNSGASGFPKKKATCLVFVTFYRARFHFSGPIYMRLPSSSSGTGTSEEYFGVGWNVDVLLDSEGHKWNFRKLLFKWKATLKRDMAFWRTLDI